MRGWGNDSIRHRVKETAEEQSEAVSNVSNILLLHLHRQKPVSRKNCHRHKKKKTTHSADVPELNSSTEPWTPWGQKPQKNSPRSAVTRSVITTTICTTVLTCGRCQVVILIPLLKKEKKW